MKKKIKVNRSRPKSFINCLYVKFKIGEEVLLIGYKSKILCKIQSIQFNEMGFPRYNVSLISPVRSGFIGHLDWVDECYLEQI